MLYNPHSLESVLKLAQRIQTTDTYIFHYCAHLIAGFNLSKLFVDCQVMVIVWLYKYYKCLV